MSFAEVRPFLRDIMDGLGYREWTDAFNVENLPDTILDKSYHISVGEISGGPANHLVHTFDFGVTLRTFFKGYDDPGEALDSVLLRADEIVGELLLPENRHQTTIKDIIPDSVRLTPQADSNDNNIVLEMDMTFILYCGIQ